MKLHQLIIERKRPLDKQPYRFPIEEVKAWKMIARFCKDAIPDLNNPIVRGTRGASSTATVQLIHGAAGSRKSANTTNYYTVILDKVLTPLGFPKRSASIICANWKNRKHASGYGEMYAIIPFDGVKIGVCPNYDMWDTEIKLGGWTKTIQRWNREFKYMGVRDSDTYDKMIEILELKAESLEDMGWKHSDETWMKAFLPGLADKTFKDAYMKAFKLTTTKEASYNDGKRHEVWIGGKCVAIHMPLFDTMMSRNMTEAEMYGWDEED
ncbi:hypothetical protein [Acinetobacter sp.]|uniref:hypothetical protein n=1 Tax=Acinetobacter sp. TaxID=472 RepID=UPI00388E84CD